jgi:rhodanese-related sulfurtransferase
MNDLFEGQGLFSQGILHLSAKEAYALCEKGAALLDVRKDIMNQYKVFDVNEVIYCPYNSIVQNILLLPKNKPLIVADAVGLHSKEVLLALVENGFENLANLAGGIMEWERDGLPIKIDKKFELNGACVCRLRPRNI